VTVAKVRPYVHLVRTWVNDRPNASQLWAAFDNAVAALVDTAGPIARTTHRSSERLAIRDLQRVFADVGPRPIVETVSAMVILWEREPHVFKSDRAYWVQIARRVRGLTERHCGTYWNEGQKRTVRVYRDGKATAMELLGRMLVESLGAIGLRIGQLEAAEGQLQENARRSVEAAFAAAAGQVVVSPPAAACR
jgi:hypothetical protein